MEHHDQNNKNHRGFAGQQTMRPLRYIVDSSRVLVQFVPCFLAVSAMGISSVFAQEVDQPQRSKRVLEEVIVTAQKREQAAQDVPMSMSVMTDEFLVQQGVTDISDALLFTPNFSVEELPNATSPQCRGFTVDSSNPAFEPPCGIAIDGIAYTRPFYFSSALTDVQRIEVLRGPQGTTFGKNTTAGVVSVITKDPTEEFTADISAQYGIDPRRERIEAGVSGPLISQLVHFRLAGLWEERDGSIKNTTAAVDPEAPEYSGGRDRQTLRGKLDFPNVFGTQVKLTYEAADFSFVGNTSELIMDPNSPTAQYYRQFDPNADFKEGNYTNSIAGSSTGKRTSDRMQIDWNWSLANWDMTFVAGAGEILSDADVEAFAAPIKWIHSLSKEGSPFEAFEFRVLSPDFQGLFGLDSLFGWDLGQTNMLFGVFSQSQDLDLDGKVDFDHRHTVGLSATGFFGQPLPVDLLLALQEQADAGDTKEHAFVLYDQTSKAEAVFASMTWFLTKEWKLELSGRYSEEEKTGDWHTRFSDPAPLLNPLNDREFTAHRTRSESNLQPRIALGFAPNDDLNFFVHWTRGFKGGGFNANTIFGNPEESTTLRDGTGSLSFNDEQTEEWGVDAKMDLLDGAMRLNISLYHMRAEDFQVLVDVVGESNIPSVDVPLFGNTGSLLNVFNAFSEVRNAAVAEAKGVEIDLTWLATDWLTVIGTVGINDSEFVEFKNASCSPERIARGERDPETETCDVSGEPFPFASKYGNTLSLLVNTPLDGLWGALDGYNFLAGTTVEYTSKYFGSSDLSESSVQPSYWRVRGHVGVENPSQGWTFRVTGLNLTDELVYTRLSDDGTTRIGYPADARTFFAQLDWRY